jgi:hypothetical protein
MWIRIRAVIIEDEPCSQGATDKAITKIALWPFAADGTLAPEAARGFESQLAEPDTLKE